jgi:hypothetical protein
MQPRGLHGGHHNKILSRDHGGFSAAILLLNLVDVPIVPYEYLFCPPSSDRLWPPAQWRASGLLLG